MTTPRHWDCEEARVLRALVLEPPVADLFPIQSERGASPHPLRIPWSVAERAYSVYAGKYGRSQPLERLAERGGFCPSEMDEFLPTWKEEASEITALRTEVARLRAVLETTPEELAEAMITTDGNITAAFSYQRTAVAALAYLKRKAGVTA